MNIYEKIAAFQQKFTGVDLDSINPHFKSKYCTLDNMINRAKPVMKEVGIGFTHILSIEDGSQVITTKVFGVDKKDGDWCVASSMVVPENSNPQKIGSCITYYKRYTLAGILGIVEQSDDDGNAGSEPKPEKPAFVNRRQEKMIKEGLHESGGDPDKFLKWLGADSFQKILASDFGKAMGQINKKIDQATKEKDNESDQ